MEKEDACHILWSVFSMIFERFVNMQGMDRDSPSKRISTEEFKFITISTFVSIKEWQAASCWMTELGCQISCDSDSKSIKGRQDGVSWMTRSDMKFTRIPNISRSKNGEMDFLESTDRMSSSEDERDVSWGRRSDAID